jgi:hypothetical protein
LICCRERKEYFNGKKDIPAAWQEKEEKARVQGKNKILRWTQGIKKQEAEREKATCSLKGNA